MMIRSAASMPITAVIYCHINAAGLHHSGRDFEAACRAQGHSCQDAARRSKKGAEPRTALRLIFARDTRDTAHYRMESSPGVEVEANARRERKCKAGKFLLGRSRPHYRF